jgi:hypothetical protein
MSATTGPQLRSSRRSWCRIRAPSLPEWRASRRSAATDTPLTGLQGQRYGTGTPFVRAVRHFFSRELELYLVPRGQRKPNFLAPLSRLAGPHGISSVRRCRIHCTPRAVDPMRSSRCLAPRAQVRFRKRPPSTTTRHPELRTTRQANPDAPRRPEKGRRTVASPSGRARSPPGGSALPPMYSPPRVTPGPLRASANDGADR